MKKNEKKYLVIFDRIDYFGKYLGQTTMLKTEKELLQSIRDKFSKKYWSEFKIVKIYEIKQDVTLEKLEQVNKTMKRNRDEKKINDAFSRARYGF